MSDDRDLQLEPERYELHAPATYRFAVDRRDFFKHLGFGIVVLYEIQDAMAFQESGAQRRGGGGNALPQEIGGWLHIGEDNVITVFTGKVEVGQNARTSLTQVAVEELRAPVSSIRLVMGDTDLTPFDQGTFGSQTTPQMVPRIRRAAAAARDLLADLAADKWSVDRSSVVVADGKVSHPPTKRSATFGELSRGQKLVKRIADNVETTPAKDWKIAGTSVPKVDGRARVTGAHRYSSDIRRPGMLFGKVLRPPSFEAKLDAVDASKAEAIPGVQVIRDGSFVAVAAPTEQAAAEAVNAIQAKWTETPQPSSREIFEYLKKNPTTGRGGGGGGGGGAPRGTGSIADGMAAAHKRLDQTYQVAYIAHIPLEPRAAVAEWIDGRLTVWAGTQRPFGHRSELAQAFGIAEDRVRVLVPDTGSGYGGKHTGEAAIEAARIAKGAGKPVKLVWTREEEFTWAYFRPAGVIEVSSGVTNDGKIMAWEFHNYNSGASAIGTMYAIPNQKIEFHPTRSPLKQGSYRGLAATANHFARETHMDELAHAVGMDPLAFRLVNLSDQRLRAVLEAAAERFGWGKQKPAANHGFGIAGGFEKNSYVATVAEIAVDPKKRTVSVVRAVTAFDCGAVINPDHLKNQIDGSVIMGIGGALFEAVEFENGKILNPRFSRYRVPRFGDVPKLETVLIDRKDVVSAGAGETPIVAIAPAIGNAIFAATGIRLRSLPMAPNGLRQS